MSKSAITKPLCKPKVGFTEQEHNTFLKALAVHGKNCKKISQILKTKNYQQVKWHARKITKMFQDDPSLDGAYLLDILMVKRNKRQKSIFTDEEHATFLQAVETYGKDYTKISQVLKTKNYQQVRWHGEKVMKLFKNDKTLEGAHLLEILE